MRTLRNYPLKIMYHYVEEFPFLHLVFYIKKFTKTFENEIFQCRFITKQSKTQIISQIKTFRQ